MNWKKNFKPPAFEIGPLPTPEDVRVRRRLREEVRPFPLDRIDELSPVDLFAYPPDRGTSLGWEPFDLRGPRKAVADRETKKR